jgi:glutamate formiminotransferase
VVYNLIKTLAESYGVTIAEAELVGPVPMAALQDVVRTCLQVHKFEIDQIIESHLLG